MAEGLMIHWYIRPDQFLYVDLSFGTFNVVLLYNLPTCTDCNVTYLYIFLIKIQQMPILWQLWYLKSSQDFFKWLCAKKVSSFKRCHFPNIIPMKWIRIHSVFISMERQMGCFLLGLPQLFCGEIEVAEIFTPIAVQIEYIICKASVDFLCWYNWSCKHLVHCIFCWLLVVF